MTILKTWRTSVSGCAQRQGMGHSIHAVRIQHAATLPCDLPPAVYNLSNGVDVQQTETKVTEYERANRASIIANQARQVGMGYRTDAGASRGCLLLPWVQVDDGLHPTLPYFPWHSQLEEQRAAQKAAFQAAAQEAQQQTVDTAAAGYIPSAAAM